MLEFYKRKRDEHFAAYLAAVEMGADELAAKHLKEYENYAQQVKALT